MKLNRRQRQEGADLSKFIDAQSGRLGVPVLLGARQGNGPQNIGGRRRSARAYAASGYGRG